MFKGLKKIFKVTIDLKIQENLFYKIDDVKIFTSSNFSDERGSLKKFYSSDIFNELTEPIKQINFVSNNKIGQIRGMHYQSEKYNEAKFVICLKGSLCDAFVDMRKNSKTYLSYDFHILKGEADEILYLPPGIAHGYQTLSEETEILYLHTDIYRSEDQQGINPFDPLINIQWPLECSQISEKDKNLPLLKK